MFVKDFVNLLKPEVNVRYRGVNNSQSGFKYYDTPEKLGLMVFDSVVKIEGNTVDIFVKSENVRPFLDFEEFSSVTGYKLGDTISFRFSRRPVDECSMKITDYKDRKLWNHDDTYLGFDAHFLHEYRKNGEWLPFGVVIK